MALFVMSKDKTGFLDPAYFLRESVAKLFNWFDQNNDISFTGIPITIMPTVLTAA